MYLNCSDCITTILSAIRECENIRGFVDIRENRKGHERASADHRKKVNTHRADQPV